MTTIEARDYFLVQQDKFGSPNVIDNDVLRYLNQAVNEYLNKLIPDAEGGVVNFEEDKNIVADIQPLIYIITTTTDSSGILTDTAINAALVSQSVAGAEYLRIMSNGTTSGGYPVKYMRQNNRWSFERNYFKKPTTINPKFTLISGGLKFYPAATTQVTVALIKKPNVLSLSPVVNPELGDYQMYSVIMLALKLAGVSTRDTELLEDVRLASIKS